MEGFNVKDKSLLENKEFLQELMERMMLVHTFEERAFWLFGQGLVAADYAPEHWRGSNRCWYFSSTYKR